MWFRLALALGMTVRECQTRVSSAEFTEWLAYAQIEPFGSPFEDLRAGTVAAAMYNVHRDTKKRPEPFGPRDVIPWLDGAGKSDSEPVLLSDPKEQAAMMRASLFGKRNG